jgi:membrane protease YdiL (CAAX protease family)
MNNIILLSHPMFGVLGIFAAIWVFVEALNAREGNAARLRYAALGVAIFIALAWIFGGYWYTHFYGPEKAMILKGPWPWAHNLVMETKEHLFFVPLVLALYLPIVTRQKLFANGPARAMTLAVSALIVLTSFAVEGGGALISYGLKVAMLHG